MPPRPIDPSDFQGCRKAALKSLARRDFCRNELRSKLVRQGYESQIAAAVIQALEESKLLDDRAYIEHFISHQSGRGQGPDRISRKLLALGLNCELVGRLIEEGHDWAASAQEARRKKFGPLLPTVKDDIHKQSQFLRYRGFATAQIRAALRANIEIDVMA